MYICTELVYPAYQLLSEPHLSCLVNTASISVTNFIPNLSLSLTSMFSDIFLKYFMTEQKKFLTDDAGDDGSGRADL